MEEENKSPCSPFEDFLSEFRALETPGKGVKGRNGRLEEGTFPSRSKFDGLEHLSKLLNVMERMEALRKVSHQLKHKCDFLENTKMLLKVQNIQLLMEQSEAESFRRERRSKTGQRKVSAVGGARHHTGGHRRNSAGARRSSLSQMHKQQRSQSVSSIRELVDLDLGGIDEVSGSAVKLEAPPETRKDPRKSRTSEERRSLKLQEKWKQVKKVFSGKTETTVGGRGVHEHGAVSAELLLRSNSRRASGSSVVSTNKNRSCSVSGECSALQVNQSVLLSPTTRQRDEEPPSLLPTPSIVLAESPKLLRPNSQQAPNIAWNNPLSKITRSQIIPQEENPVARCTPGDDESDESSFTPWVQQTPLRRQSSPLTSVSQPPPGGSTAANGFLSVDPTPVHLLGRSSSFKVSKAVPEVGGEDPASKSLPSTPVQPTQTSADSNQPQLGNNLLSPDAGGRKTKGPWGMVKGIIQTRRESLKSRNGKGDDDLQDEDSTQDTPGVLGPTPITTSSSSKIRKLNSRKMSVTPNLSMRFGFFKNTETSSPQATLPASAGGKRYSLSSTAMSPGSPVDLATLFGVNDDFTKKMQEWEEKKKRMITKGSPPTSSNTAISGSTKFSEDFIRKMEEWEEKKKGHGGCKPGGGAIDGPTSPCRISPEGSGNPLSPPAPAPSGEELQRFLSESFSRTVQDWEEVRRRQSQSKDREKSKKVRSVSRERDKSQQRAEKQLKKIEKKEKKLELELRKLTELRLKIDQQLENSSASEKISAIDRRSSHEVTRIDGWNEDQTAKDSGDISRMKVKNSRSKKDSPGCTLGGREEAQGLSDGAYTAPVSPSTGSGRHQSASLSQSSLDSLSSSQSFENAELTRSRDGSLRRCRRSHSDRQSTSSAYRRTLSSPGSALRYKGKTQPDTNLTRRTEEQLRRRVAEKEDEVNSLQNDVHQLTNQINNLNKVYSETIDQFQRELWSSSRLGQQVIQSDEVSIILSQLTNRLDLLQQHGDRMAKEIGQTQTKICKEANNRRQTEQQLLHNLEQLHWIIEGPTASSSLAEVVIHLCSYVTKLLSKASVLRQCISERNLLIQELERHLLIQEVINKLLQADIERHAIELSHLKEFQRLAVIKRWKTFNGSDHLGRDEQSDISRPHEPIFPKIPQSSKKVQTLLTQMTNDPESLDIDTDWLTTIRKDAELALNLVTRGMQTDCFTALPARAKDTTHASAQTVMTFCDCDSVPAQLPSPSNPFRQVPTSGAALHPPLLITPSCNNNNSPSPSRNGNAVTSVDKCFLFPPFNKPRKTSAPDFSTDVGEDPVWLRSSAFRAISSSYSDRIQNLDEHATPNVEASTAQQGSAPARSACATNASSSLVDVPSMKSARNVRTDDRIDPQESGVGNAVAVSCTAPLSTQHLSHQPDGSHLNLTSVDKLSSRSAHSPLIHSKCPRKQKWVNTQPNQCPDAETDSSQIRKAPAARPGFKQSRSLNVERFVDDDDEDPVGLVDLGVEEVDTDVVFSGSDDSFCWTSNIPRLRETHIDESCFFDIQEIPEGQGAHEVRPETSRHSVGPSQSVDQRRAGSWSGGQDPGTPRGTAMNRPIVVRKLKSATELMYDCGKRRTRPTSVPEERSNHHCDWTHTKNTPSTSTPKDQQRTAGRGRSFGGAEGSESLSGRRTGYSRNGSSGSDDTEKHHHCHSHISTAAGSEVASPAISKDCSNRFKPITPVLKSAARCQESSVKSSVMVDSSSEASDVATSGMVFSDVYHDDRSCASSCSSIPTVELNFQSQSNRYRGAYYTKEESAPESPGLVGARTSRKGSRSQPAAAASPRAGTSRAAKSMCRALCLQAMSVELTDDSTDSSLSHQFTPHTGSPSPYPTSAPVQPTEGEPEFHKGRGSWLQKPYRKLFKALK